MNKKKWSLFAILLALVLVLAACSGDKDGGNAGGKDKPEPKKVDTSAFPMAVDNKDEAIKGGALEVALVSSSPFKGIFLAELYEDGYDSDIMDFASNNLFAVKQDFLISDTGIGALKVDEKNNKATVTIRKEVKWSDGEPLTIDDVIYPYEIIGHKDYTGIRYDVNFKNIVGAEEYHAGKEKTISGLKKIDDYNLEISFKELSPAIYTGGDGLWAYAAPKHYLKDVAIKELIKSDKVRKSPVTLGAFKFDKIVNGESVQFLANEHYWKGKPKVDKAVITSVPPTQIGKALKAGKYDIATSFPATEYDSIKDAKNLTILGRPELAYTYIAFKLGKRDSKKGIAIPNPDAKMNDVNLRHAFAYAMDVEQVADEYYEGLRTRSKSLIPPVFELYYDDTLEGFKYDPEKAKKLLDDAGYKDVDGDGLREDKNGEKLEIKLAAMAGSDKDEAIVSYYLQNWKEVGLNVVLTTGRLIEFNSFYEKVRADDKDIDVFQAALGTGSDPSPAGAFSPDSQFNTSRFATPELDKLLAKIDSKEALDPEVRAKAFKDWQLYMFEQAPIFPIYSRTEVMPVNKRIKNYDKDHFTKMDLNELELTADKPIK
ncbi:oligopeptide ABC transporter substrate-binding protein [Viridibacillus sp. YIM B01967]|uniref:Oligopeptide ABC transporter substrate-binding protein n=1 Tax=Viridibacillus soli TaxID=2798301 RepID=A0ABS1HBP4_9BACL|nr:oligopeptide ABC transporter substrate-binding protein [Viridibacillus soli]MBK3496832.1 oligopeptide ABC transporter substrate-binding protein [Viridibacillus soli]